MSRNGSFGVNYKKSYGTAPSINEAVLGDRGSDRLGEYIFVKASGAISQYGLVIVDKAFTATAATITNTTTPAASIQGGIAQVALADTEYGWVWIGNGGGTGSGIKVLIAASYTAGNILYSNATAGKADGSSTGSAIKINNLQGLTTLAAAGSIEVMANGYVTFN